MRKLFKKSLACVLAVALCLTAMVGVVVSADTVEPLKGKIDIADATIDGTTATIPVEFTLDDERSDVINHAFVYVVATGATVISATPAEGTPYAEYSATKGIIEFWFNAEGEGGSIEANVDIKVELAENVEEFKIALSDYTSASYGEILINFGTEERTFVLEVCDHAETTSTDSNVVPATCTEAGSKTVTVTCEACGAEISKEENVVIPALEHDMSVDVPAVDATCTTPGTTAGKKCSRCDVTEGITDVDALGHAWVDGEITYTDCTSDGNKAQSCSRCDATQTVVVAPKGHTEVANEEVPATCTTVGYTGGTHCDVCDAVIKAATEVPALGHKEVYTNNGDNHTVTCSNGCDMNVTEDHSFVDGECVCGAAEPVVGPIVDDTLVFAGAAPGYGNSSLQVNFRIRNNILTKYDNMELVIIPDKYDLSTLNLVENPEEIVVPYAKLSGTGTFRTYLYTDIQLYELGLTIRYMLKGTDTEGNAVQSPVYETSIASYLKKLYGESSDTKFRTLLVDTLVVGDEAAKKMAVQYPESDLAKASSIIEGFDISEATPSVDSYNTIDVHNATDSAWGTESGTHKVARSIVIEKVPSISYRIRGGSSIDLEKFTVTVSYTQVAGDGTQTPYNRTFTSADTANIYKSGSFLMFKFDEIGLQDGDKNLTIVANYDGAEVFNAEYSIETYLGSSMTNADIGDLCTAIIKLGISFRAYSAK